MNKTLWTSAVLCLALVSCNKQSTVKSTIIKEKYVHEYGLEIDESEWKTHGKTGEVIKTLDNGVILKQHYTEGTLDGEVTYTHQHSNKIHRTEVYELGQLKKVIINDELGNPVSENQYTEDGLETFTTWYDSGIPKSMETYKDSILLEGEYLTLENAEESKIENGEGIRTNRNPAGELISSDYFENGKIVYSTEYHPNGALKCTTPYANNLAHGYKKFFQLSGEPESIERWKQGYQDGLTLVYKNGEKFAEVPYIKGYKDGVEKRYRDGNIVIEEISWKNGLLHGPAITFIEGTPSKTIWYYQNKIVPKTTFDLKTRRKLDGLKAA